jgi:CheY-like chemotaxis protein
LPQVLGLAKQLGGGVEIVTATGQGTTVSVFLPRALDRPAVARPEPSVPAPQLASLTVLLVDDDADVRSVGRAMLAELGCKPVEASGGAEALALIQQGVAVDVALVDFAMPGLNGAEVADQLKTLRPGLPVVMMSGFADQDLLSARWSGSLLHKPFGAAPLAAALTSARGGAAQPQPA